MKSKRILLIIPEMAMGGAQRSLSKLSLELAKDHKVWLLIFNRNHKVAYSHGGELLSLDVVPGNSVIGKISAFITRTIRVKRLKAKLKIDVAISFLEGADYINILSKRTEQVVLGIRGSKLYDETIEGKFSWIRNKMFIPWLYPKADHIVTVNHGIGSELVEYYGLQSNRILTIGNYYNISEITELSLEPKHEHISRLYQDPVLITTGRFAPEKGLNKLIQVFAKLKIVFSNLRLVMLGDGPEFEKLLTTIKESDLIVCVGNSYTQIPDVLILKGEVNVFKYLRGASVYLMNSSSEGFPNGLAEAMICEAPVVTADCPYGPREILEPDVTYDTELLKPHMSRNGILMPVIRSQADVDLWVETLSTLISNAELRNGLAKNARDRIAFFDKDLIISRWHSLLQ